MWKISILLIFSLAACSKTPIIEASDAMVGNWIHYTAVGSSHKIIINADGSGSMAWQVDGKSSKATKVRDWYIKDNTLFFGKAAFNGESYDIRKYPTITWTEIIKYYDTIPETARFIILDDAYYVEIE